MTLLGFKTILHKKCRSGKNSEGPAENFWVPLLTDSEKRLGTLTDTSDLPSSFSFDIAEISFLFFFYLFNYYQLNDSFYILSPPYDNVYRTRNLQQFPQKHLNRVTYRAGL
jgi:hypothetical protein